MKKVILFIYNIYAIIIFVVVMFLLFPFFAVASLFGKIKGGNMMYSICRIWADIFLFCIGITHKNIFEAPKATDHPVIFVFNHISYMDIPIMMKTFRNKPIRILAKAEMAKIPIFGFIYRNAAVMVNRTDDVARAKSVVQLKNILSKNISILISPEGTFNMTNKPLKEFYNGAFKIAVEMQIPIQPVLFLDAYDRMNYKSIFSITMGKSRAIFLQEIKAGSDATILKEHVYNKMEADLVRYKASWISI